MLVDFLSAIALDLHKKQTSVRLLIFKSFIYRIFIEYLLSAGYYGQCQGYERHKSSFPLYRVYVSQTVSIFIHGNLFHIPLPGPWGYPKETQVWREGEKCRK